MRRISVIGECTPRCPSCVACRPGSPSRSVDEVLIEIRASRGDIALGGGDVTRWAPLAEVLRCIRVESPTRRVWLDLPAASMTEGVARELASEGVAGVIVSIEALGEEMRRVLRVGDGEQAIAIAEGAGLSTQARLLIRPKTFPIVAPLARRLAPRIVWLELVRSDWGKPEVAMPLDAIERLMGTENNLQFSVHRSCESGYLPPCALPSLWVNRPDAFRAVLDPQRDRNQTFDACARCSLADRCPFRDAGAIESSLRTTLQPIEHPVLPWEDGRTLHDPVPAAITRRRDARDVLCTTPWTTMEIVDPDGRVRQCCSTWTIGDRGNVREATLESIWNGEGYQRARRAISNSDHGTLCAPICSRLHDRKYEERAFVIQRGSPAFVQNQLVIAEEIATRAERLTGKPLRMALCPSTYCNYDCIMCDHGRSPRRELPERVWDELPEFLPTLQSLTFLGGEPLAQPRMIKLLSELDPSVTPDLSIDFVTNGSLLTPKVLERLARCPLGDVTISLNAGTEETYERVQRGIGLAEVHANIDALLELRRRHPRWFGVTVSFVIQPEASATLIPFAEFAHRRGLRIRLMALNPEQHEGLDFYVDPELVARVIADVDRLVSWAEKVRPEWLLEIRAARAAVLGEAAERRRGVGPSVGMLAGGDDPRRLPVVS